MESGIPISGELHTVTLPFTATQNIMMQVKITHATDNNTHYLYLKSEKYGNQYYAFVGGAVGGATSEWVPVQKGDTISLQGSSGASGSYAIFS